MFYRFSNFMFRSSRLSGDSKGDLGGSWPPQIFAWPPLGPPPSQIFS